MKLTVNRIIFITVYLYIVLGVFAYRNEWLESCFFIALLLLMAVSSTSIRKTVISHSTFICSLIVVVCVLSSLMFGAKGQIYTVSSFICLLLIELMCENGVFENNKKKTIDLFYLLMLFFAVGYMLYAYSQGERRIRTLMGDQNYTGILVVCIFLYANKRNYISGILLAIVYGVVFSYSRTYFLLIILFYVFLLIKKPIYRFLNKKNSVFMLFVIGPVFMIIISYYWVYFVSAHGFTLDKTSFNDFSNRNRALSILYAVKMIRETPSMIFWGYGNRLLSVMGITGTDYATHTVYMGMRLAQPHNSVLNMCVKCGIIPTIIYYYLVSKVLKRFLNEENMPYFIPFFLNAMFMHTLFSYQWLAFLTIILSLPQNNWKETIRIKIKRRDQSKNLIKPV